MGKTGKAKNSKNKAKHSKLIKQKHNKLRKEKDARDSRLRAIVKNSQEESNT